MTWLMDSSGVNGVSTGFKGVTMTGEAFFVLVTSPSGWDESDEDSSVKTRE
jgi:hypothetical protein